MGFLQRLKRSVIIFSCMLTLGTVLGAEKTGSYSQGYWTAQDKGEQLLVLLTTKWCPGCRLVEKNLVETGLLGKKGILVVIDVESNPDRGLFKDYSKTIPRLLVYSSPTKDGKGADLKSELVGYPDIMLFAGEK